MPRSSHRKGYLADSRAEPTSSPSWRLDRFPYTARPGSSSPPSPESRLKAPRPRWHSSVNWPVRWAPPWSPRPMASGYSAGTRPRGRHRSAFRLRRRPFRRGPRPARRDGPTSAGPLPPGGPWPLGPRAMWPTSWRGGGGHGAPVPAGAEGYVADQLEWRAPTGRYVADVTLATSGPVNVEVWNDTGNPAVLLSRRT